MRGSVKRVDARRTTASKPLKTEKKRAHTQFGKIGQLFLMFYRCRMRILLVDRSQSGAGFQCVVKVESRKWYVDELHTLNLLR